MKPTTPLPKIPVAAPPKPLPSKRETPPLGSKENPLYIRLAPEDARSLGYYIAWGAVWFIVAVAAISLAIVALFLFWGTVFQ